MSKILVLAALQIQMVMIIWHFFIMMLSLTFLECLERMDQVQAMNLRMVELKEPKE